MKSAPGNNASESMESRMAAVPLREIPPEWKSLILTPLQTTPPLNTLGDRARGAGVLGWISHYFAVSRVGLWPALGAVWVAIAVAQLSLPKAHPQSKGVAHSLESRGTPLETEALREIHRSLAQLMQRNPSPSKPRPTPPPHLLYYRDRSRHATELLG